MPSPDLPRRRRDRANRPPRRHPRAATAALVSSLILHAPAAIAQVRLHVDAALAAPTGGWQSDRYLVGGGLAVGLEWAPAAALGLTANVGWTALVSREAGQSGGVPVLGTGSMAAADLGLRLRPLGRSRSGAERLFVEVDGGVARTGTVFAPVVRARVGWSFAAGAVDVGPWVGWTWMPQTDASAYAGDASLVLAGVGITLFPDRPRRASRPVVMSPARAQCPAIVGPSLPDVDGDGCRERDFDDDRVRDAVDRCPTLAEDRDGFEDDDGCPEPDNDRDGIADAADRCPDVAEVVNGVDDQDGCPDEGVVELRGGRIIVEESVFFDFGSARIRERSRPVIEAIAAIIRDVPASHPVLIEGHADNRGSDVVNFNLSYQRALAVGREVTALGVPAAQLRAIGFGRRVPRAGGSSTGDLAANRRVEIIVSSVGSPGDALTAGGWVHFDADGTSHPISEPTP